MRYSSFPLWTLRTIEQILHFSYSNGLDAPCWNISVVITDESFRLTFSIIPSHVTISFYILHFHLSSAIFMFYICYPSQLLTALICSLTPSPFILSFHPIIYLFLRVLMCRFWRLSHIFKSTSCSKPPYHVFNSLICHSIFVFISDGQGVELSSQGHSLLQVFWAEMPFRPIISYSSSQDWGTCHKSSYSNNV